MATHSTRREAVGIRRRWPLASTAGRLRILLLVLAVWFSLAGAQAVRFQVLEASGKAQEAAANMTHTQEIRPLRGEIRDRDGKVLAFTEATVDLQVEPPALARNGKGRNAQLSPKDEENGRALPGVIAPVLAKHIPPANLNKLTPDQIQGAISDPSKTNVIVAKQVSISVYNAIQADLAAIAKPDRTTYPYGLAWTVVKQSNPKRVYPMNTVASNVVGYLGEGKGVAGLEKSFESTLGGTVGREIYNTSKNGKIPLGESTLTPAVDGTSIQTTLDSGLCWNAQQLIDAQQKKMNAEWAVTVVMEVKTGKLLCLANSPTFDGNNVGGADVASLNNPAMTYPYEPGSTMKLLTLASVLDASSETGDPVTPDTVTHVASKSEGIKSAENTIHDSDDHPAVDYTTRGILVNSSNQGVIQLARRVFSDHGRDGKQAYADYLAAFGLGQKTNIGLPAEHAGTLPTDKIVKDSYTLDSVSFGTSLAVNAVQMAAAVNTVVNDGVYVAPSLIEATTGPDGKVSQSAAPATHRVLKSTTSTQVREMMENRVLDSYTRIGIQGYRTGAKTGTARMGKNDLITSIAGVAPIEDPQILVYTVFFQKDTRVGAGISQAGPVYKNIMSLALQRYGVQPSENAQQYCVQQKLTATDTPQNKCTTK